MLGGDRGRGYMLGGDRGYGAGLHAGRGHVPVSLTVMYSINLSVCLSVCSDSLSEVFLHGVVWSL